MLLESFLIIHLKSLVQKFIWIYQLILESIIKTSKNISKFNFVWISKKILSLFLFLSFFVHFMNPQKMTYFFFVEEYCKDVYPHRSINQLLFVAIKQQKIYLIRHGHMVTSYPISTSKYGVGNLIHSKKTPTGLHIIEHKIGKGVPSQGIIKGGVYTGEQIDLEHYPVTKKR